MTWSHYCLCLWTYSIFWDRRKDK